MKKVASHLIAAVGLLVAGAIAAGILPEDYLAGCFFAAGVFQGKVSQLVEDKLINKKGE